MTIFTLTVDGGHRAIKYTRLFGVQNKIYNEGTHFVVPWFETPIIYDVRAKPRNVASLTGTKGKLIDYFLDETIFDFVKGIYEPSRLVY